ncbi:succinylglutamate desuccinylase/aspartoacylase family protein [Flavobacterium psychrophilum]|jgi:predicted deacylase|uniref:Succinylglutamate desuccinylase/Aspartoacylase catalytic domain-containing protein n=2 Tax=Flavobacterium psychrophilum TaxID=96345 RepID=A6GW64_FLAPJ|nr:succinylglutamate desuccinylase/aspartoacylase family protein [Flavobacterium psychrophilum]AIG29149.1 succinylglutamate desuccinylase [Flavobacterium psychrophilum]AIG31426.1 succinylglutamate desuccinylase [Flavobacterium psychrophilum]AIG33583.1 succinylglutamate desuccinylase [Flavobacterium psychrophilum]AIG35950.1 succinylglutamate desuccinylase [Flavobacterium psychrophilum]AIG38206.1 succinylglutamate desuccinylase [Flavobacterium psychrophilum]
MKKTKTITILGESIKAGESKTIDMEIARLHTTTKLKIPVIVERSTIDGPVILFSAGIHGDEINGVEIIRQLIIQKINKPKTGTIICIPIINMFGFVNKSREFPDGRDLNRVFPGSKKGSLASRFAHHILEEIMPVVDYAIDFHAGGASRFNAPQIRITPNNLELKKLADVFDAPFTLYSKNIAGSFRNSADKMNIKMLLFEGGKSLDINKSVANEGVNGVKRILEHLAMLNNNLTTEKQTNKTIYIQKSGWLRAKRSGLFHDNNLIGSFVEKGTILGTITDPFGKFEQKVKAPANGYVINANHSPIIYQGDAIYHISNIVGDGGE